MRESVFEDDPGQKHEVESCGDSSGSVFGNRYSNDCGYFTEKEASKVKKLREDRKNIVGFYQTEPSVRRLATQCF